MMALAPKIGRDNAREVVQDVYNNCIDKGIMLATALENHSLISKHLAKEDIAIILDPANYLGTATQMIDRTISLARESR